MRMSRIALYALAFATPTIAIAAEDPIRIVGSSTVFPFSTAVAERFGKATQHPTPIVESTGTGGGFKLFCSGIGPGTPDIANASRPIKESELKQCTENGVKDIVEVKIGFDGIVLAKDKAGSSINLTKEQIFMALAKSIPQNGRLAANPFRNWSEIDPSLPASKIEVLGPPPTSGTRDAFVELVMDEACKKLPGAKEAGLEGKECGLIREDGAYIEAGENDNLIVQKLTANKNALGIFGYSFLEENLDQLQAATVDGITPTFENIADGKYGVARSIFFYVKKAHLPVKPAIQEFVAEFVSDRAMGDEGYLADRGLISLPSEERRAVAKKAIAMETITQ